jgi:hypothetical protein
MPAYAPRVWISIGGATIPCISARVHRKAERNANEFTATVAISASSKFGLDFSSWASMEKTDVSIMMATDSNQREMIQGTCDFVQMNVMQNTVTVSGRDNAAKLINAKANISLKNKSVQEAIEEIVKPLGLSAQVSGGDDSGKVGKKYVQDTTLLIADKSAFAAISGIADREGARWYVEGKTVYFDAGGSSTGGGSFTLNYTPPRPGQPARGNILDLQLGRNMEASRPHKSKVSGFNKYEKKLIIKTYKADGSGDPVEYKHHHNGHQEENIKAIAKSRLEDTIRHEMNVSATLHIDLSVDVRQQLQLSGTGSIYDQSYDIDDAVFSIGWEQPATVHLTCRSKKEGREVSEDGDGESDGGTIGADGAGEGGSGGAADGGAAT